MFHEEPTHPRLRPQTVRIARLVALALIVWAAPALAQETDAQPKPDAAAKVAALKQSLQAGSAALRKYEWVETTTLSLKGEEKSSTQKQCYYGADGALQQIPIADADGGQKKSPRGVRGKIVANKKEDMKDYMTEAVALVKQYVPPDPARIQAAKDAGKMSLTPLSASKLQLQFRDYIKAGDVLSVYVDPTTDRLLGLRVSSHLEKPEDLVTLDVTMNTLGDGALYPAETVLVAQAKELRVDIKKSGHRLMTAPN